MMRKAWVVGLLVVLALAVPTLAYADDETPISCTVTLAVTDPGTAVQKGNEVRTKGEKTAGQLDCDFNALDGAISTAHKSEVKLNPDGSFTGELDGTFEVATSGGTVKGKIEAMISGVIIGFVGPYPIYTVTDTGEWEIKGGPAKIKGEGSLTITLVGIVGAPASLGGLKGSGSLAGEVETKGKD